MSSPDGGFIGENDERADASAIIWRKVRSCFFTKHGDDTPEMPYDRTFDARFQERNDRDAHSRTGKTFDGGGVQAPGNALPGRRFVC